MTTTSQSRETLFRGHQNLVQLEGKYLTFKLDEEEYGLEILKVQEIVKMMSITRVPRTPLFIRGVVNLRGKVIPVIDIRLKFEMPTVPETEKTCIIVAQVQKQDSLVTMGLIVDEVCEVQFLRADQIEPAPEFGAALDTAFILGMGKVETKVLTLLDVDRVLSTDDLTAAEKARQTHSAN